MKRALILVLLSSWAGSFLHAADPVDVKSSITDVTVFLRGAQVTREAKVTVSKGEVEYRFAGLGDGIDARSIQASAPPVVLLNSVVHEVNYMDRQKPNARIQKLQDSLEIVNESLARRANDKTVLDLEKNMLLKNQELAGKQRAITALELQKAADFFRQRMGEINARLLKNTQEVRDLNEDKKRISRQLQELNARKNQPSNDILVKIKSDYSRTISLQIRYFVEDAGWVPAYDLRAKDTQSPITLDYRADVYQNTGVDWDKVQLTLSSGNPNQGGTQPSLSQWNLYTRDPGVYGYDRGGGGIADNIRTEGAETLDYKEREKSPSSYDKGLTLADYTTVQQGATTAEFVISIAQDVPSGGKRQQVSIQSTELPAHYQHFAVPKLDDDAFLVAQVTEWEKLNLLPGNINIFFEGTYVSEAYLDPNYTRDTLDFSLGRDKKVVIQRELLKDFNKRKTIGFNRERTFGYEITIRNTKSTAISLELLDQIPVSQDDDITVKLIESSGASLKEATGRLTWNLEIPPSETKKLKLAFSVKHPKKKTVPGI